MIKKRLLSFLGAAAITAALTFAVVSLSPSNGFTSGTMQEGLCYEATGVAPDAIVASLNGNGASADLVAYWIGYDVSYLDSYMQYYTGSSLDWDYTLSDGTNITDYIKSNVYSSVKQHLVLENLANKYGVTLTEGQESAMADSDQTYIDQYGSEEAFEAEIAKLGMRRETYDRVARSNYLYQNLYQLYNTEGSALYASDEDLAVYAAEQGYITADHILLVTKDMTTGEALTDEQKAEKKALAEELVEKLNSYTGDDIASYFAELADEYSEDPGRESYPTGYTFTTGSMVQEFEDAAYALSEGEELTIFSVKQEDLKGFQMEAKRYGVLFYPIVNKVEKTGTVEIMAKARDAKQINRIFERMGYPAPVKEDTAAKKENARAPSGNSSKERGTGARASTEPAAEKADARPSVRSRLMALQAAAERDGTAPTKDTVREAIQKAMPTRE
mgnify:CR=1 FL=1